MILGQLCYKAGRADLETAQNENQGHRTKAEDGRYSKQGWMDPENESARSHGKPTSASVTERVIRKPARTFLQPLLASNAQFLKRI